MNRRGFLQLGLGIMVAPAIVRADSLMRVVPLKQDWIYLGYGKGYYMSKEEFDAFYARVATRTVKAMWPGIRACAANSYNESFNRLTEFKDYWK